MLDRFISTLENEGSSNQEVILHLLIHAKYCLISALRLPESGLLANSLYVTHAQDALAVSVTRLNETARNIDAAIGSIQYLLNGYNFDKPSSPRNKRKRSE